ncbi:MAG TPA: AAA family ATPase [Isosphaeraceae bacterium]|jgi:general secretion pathway protein A|nr:AAA family ATPase [Isosphaeraceae bacterium]
MGLVEPPEAETLLLPSRADALDTCRAALAAADGPVLVTGAAGTGKTWILGPLAAGHAGRLEWVPIDLPPTAGSADLFAAIAGALGFGELQGDDLRSIRGRLAEFLAERAEDGRRLALAIDEAHNASLEALEDIRLISNRLGRPDGFEALVLLGQTPLGRRLATPGLEALAARLSSRVHLGPIDADEAALLLNDRRQGRPWPIAEVERLHRQAAGNPRRLLRLAASPRPPVVDLSRTSTTSPKPEPAPSRATIPLIGEARPPLRVEEGLIEVGWDPGLESRNEAQAVADTSPASPVAETVERIDDHYAALQAWDEWARNQGRQPALALRPAPEREFRREDESAVEPVEAVPGPVPGHPNVWAEGEQPFAPYSQLFSRLKHSRDAE